nr:MAG TPA: hypothetical protein [Caudoviricetes sp.]
MAKTREPNTICRNPNCTHGEDGGKKHFYACMTCLRTEQWRAYCCSIDCYEEYTRIVLESRAKAKELPERTDMTKNEIEQVMNRPVEDVINYTKNVELKDYIEENPGSSISQIVDKVNADIDKKKKHK